MNRVITKKQTDILRRLLHIVGQELQTMAKSDKLPDQWGELNLTSYALEAQKAVYNLMVADGLLPGLPSTADGTAACGHKAYRAGYCGEISCTNYVVKHT